VVEQFENGGYWQSSKPRSLILSRTFTLLLLVATILLFGCKNTTLYVGGNSTANMTDTNITTSGGIVSGNIDMNGNDIINVGCYNFSTGGSICGIT